MRARDNGDIGERRDGGLRERGMLDSGNEGRRDSGGTEGMRDERRD